MRTAAVEVGGSDCRQIVVCGKKRTVEIKPIERYAGKPMMFSAATNEAVLTEEGRIDRVQTTSEQFQRYLTMISSFAAMVCGEIENPYTLDYEVSLFRTILKCCGALFNEQGGAV